MRIIIVIFLGGWFLMSLSYAREVSLVQEGLIPSQKQETLIPKTDQKIEVENKVSIEQGEDLKLMEEFIHLENEKMKDIKLLSLDLEKADLILKKREIEQKMSELISSSHSLSGKMQVEESEAAENNPTFKIVSIFMTSTLKQAILSVNEVQTTVKEGQVINSFLVKTISSRKVVLQNKDGHLKELFFL